MSRLYVHYLCYLQDVPFPPWLFVILLHFRTICPIYLLHYSPAPHFKTQYISMYRSVPFSVPHRTVLQVSHFISFFLKYESSLMVNWVSFLLNTVFSMIVPDLISHISCIICYHSIKIAEFLEIINASAIDEWVSEHGGLMDWHWHGYTKVFVGIPI
jgi:hypothetical protein